VSQPVSTAVSSSASFTAIAPASSSVAPKHINQKQLSAIAPRFLPAQTQQQQQHTKSEQKMPAITVLRTPPAWFFLKLQNCSSQKEFDRRIDQFVQQHPDQCDVDGTVTRDADGTVAVTLTPDEPEQAPVKPSPWLRKACQDLRHRATQKRLARDRRGRLRAAHTPPAYEEEDEGDEEEEEHLYLSGYDY
jgi:hypothetical protein